MIKIKDDNENVRFKELRILSTSEAIAYSLPDAGVNAILGMISSLVILYYVNIMGVHPIYVGIFYALALYLYSFLCPIWGALSDKFETKFGKKKTVMLIMGPLYALFFVLLFLNPRPTAGVEFGTLYLPIIIWFCIFLIAFRTVGAAFYSSYTSLLPELSTDEKNRIKISTIRMLTMIFGVAIALIGPILLLGETTQNLSRTDPELYYPDSTTGQNITAGIFIFTLLIAIFFLIAFIIMMVVIKEPPTLSSEASVSQVLKDLKEPFTDKNFRFFLIAYFLLWIPLVCLNFILMNLATFVIGLRGDEFLWFAVVAFISGILSFLIWNRAVESLGLKKTTSICIIISIIAFLLITLLTFPMSHHQKLIFGFIIVFICLLGYIGAMIFPWTIVSDIVDTAELKSGRSLSGAYSGAFNFILSLAAGTSMLIVSIFLEIWGAESPTAYALVFAFGAVLMVCSVIILQKVVIIGTDQRVKEKKKIP